MRCDVARSRQTAGTTANQCLCEIAWRRKAASNRKERTRAEACATTGLPADKELLAPGGLLLGMELSDFAGGENGVDVNLDGIFDATGIAAGECGYYRDVAPTGFLQHISVSDR